MLIVELVMFGPWLLIADQVLIEDHIRANICIEKFRDI